MSNDVVIIDYGAGNVHSVEFALERLGYQAALSSDPDTISAARKAIFPGVGHAKAAMDELKKTELDSLIPELQQPVFGICLGQQLFCRHSEEADANCLNIFPLEVREFKLDLKVPHMGWNQINTLEGPLFKGVEESSYVYFVHSYFVETSEFNVATTSYGLEFAAAIQKDNFFACQFHPEKSGPVGQQILQNFLDL